MNFRDYTEHSLSECEMCDRRLAFLLMMTDILLLDKYDQKDFKDHLTIGMEEPECAKGTLQKKVTEKILGILDDAWKDMEVLT